MHLADAFKQLGVQPHVVFMLRQDGLHLLSQLVHLVVRLSRQQVEEHRRNPFQQVVIAIALVKGIQDGIVESWFLGIVDSLLQILVVTTDALHEGLLVVCQLNTVKRHSVVQSAVRFEKWVLMVAHTNVPILFKVQRYK